MKSKKFTVTAANLNTGSEYELDLGISYGSNTLRPIYAYFSNDSGIDIELLYVYSSDEKSTRVKNPTLYDFFPVPSGNSYVDLPDNNRYLVFKRVNLPDVAIGDLTVHCLGYD